MSAVLPVKDAGSPPWASPTPQALPPAQSAAPVAAVPTMAPAAVMPAAAHTPSARLVLARRRARAMRVVAPLLGFALFVLIWQVISHTGGGQLPGPAKVWVSAVEVFSDPFYIKGPNDQGIGWNIISSLKRVGIGFGLAAVIGHSAGIHDRPFPVPQPHDPRRSSACCARCRRWPGFPSGYSFSRPPTRELFDLGLVDELQDTDATQERLRRHLQRTIIWGSGPPFEHGPIFAIPDTVQLVFK